MAGTRQTNTFGEMLQKLLVELAKMKLAPDADMPFIVDLETQVIGKLRAPIDQAASQGMTQVPGDPMLGQQYGAEMQGAGGGVPGLRQMPAQMPAVDELRRVLAQ